MTMAKIENQVKLPTRIALGVVLQGIRIRFGRSLVTISGVALGVAFLMSIFTGQVITQGISKEQDLRNEVSRMFGFFTAETGPIRDQIIAIIQIGELNIYEQRLVAELHDRQPKSIRWAVAPNVKADKSSINCEQTDSNEVVVGALGVLVMGQIADTTKIVAPPNQNLDNTLMVVTRNSTIEKVAQWMPEGKKVVSIQRELNSDELAEAAEVAKRAAFRQIWIITISLLVTVFGISNAMLMSVSERFREIGTMKCLGALSGFIRQIFLIESTLIGLVGSVIGVVVGVLFPVFAYGLTYGYAMVTTSMNWLNVLVLLFISIAVGMILAIVAALYPAHYASKMLPAAALRSNI